jgi:hydroxymethylbilane synthase
LAYAGLKRLGLANCVSEIFPEDQFYPAPGQGVIVAQARLNDMETNDLLKTLNHTPSEQRLECERAFLRTLEGGCRLPCGIHTTIEGNLLHGAGIIFSVEGEEQAEAKGEGSLENPAEVGERLARLVLENGGEAILERIHRLQ